jgi:hypothetical protein
MLNEEPTQYLYAFLVFLFNERIKRRDPRIQALIDEIDQEFAKRRNVPPGPIREIRPSKRVYT